MNDTKMNMRAFQKQNIPIRTINIVLVLIVLFIFFFTRSCNKYYDLLSSKKTTISIATIYERYSAGKAGRKYKYVYKAFGKFYFGKVSSNEYIDKNTLPQSFHIVYRSDDPAINVLIHQKPLKLNFNLDTIISTKMDLSIFIKHNIFDYDDANSADKQDFEELSKYRKRVKKWKNWSRNY